MRQETPEDYEPEEPEPVWCLSCLKPTRVAKVDEGIGPYEYWGFPSWHTDIRTISECCGTENHTETPPEPEALYRKLAEHLKNDEEGLEWASLLWESMA